MLLSQRASQRISVTLIFVFFIFVFILGILVSPTNRDTGKPILYSPKLREIQAYQEKTASWLADFSMIDGKLNRLLSESPDDLLSTTLQVQQTSESMIRLWNEIDQAECPSALVILRSEILEMAQSYLTATQNTQTWVNVPTEENKLLAQAALGAAQNRMNQLRENLWIRTQ